MCHLKKQVIEYLQFKNNVASKDVQYTRLKNIYIYLLLQISSDCKI
jgi:hypothetical protein